MSLSINDNTDIGLTQNVVSFRAKSMLQGSGVYSHVLHIVSESTSKNSSSYCLIISIVPTHNGSVLRLSDSIFFRAK